MGVRESARRLAIRTLQKLGPVADHAYPIQRYGRLGPGKLAATVHLFCVNRWDALAATLARRLSGTALVATMPWSNRAWIRQIQADIPGAVVYVLPDKGRDVLSFMQALRVGNREQAGAMPVRFEPAAGQVDGTHTHALEPAFGFRAALQGKQILESAAHHVRPAVPHPLDPTLTKD